MIGFFFVFIEYVSVFLIKYESIQLRKDKNRNVSAWNGNLAQLIYFDWWVKHCNSECFKLTIMMMMMMIMMMMMMMMINPVWFPY